MESRFASLRQRDTSVSMLRVKMSRRMSQTQKENRQRTVNTRRQLDKLQELERSSLDASMTRSNMSTLQERDTNTKPEKLKAQEERLKQLERWKERKTLEREKEKREKQHKGVFKTGLYHPKDIYTGPVPSASAKLKEVFQKKGIVAPSQSTRVTRSMKQQQRETQEMQNPIASQSKVKPDHGARSNRLRAAPVKSAPSVTKSKVCNDHITTAGPAVQALSTRSARRPPVTKVPVVKDKPKEKVADVRTTRARAAVNPVAPSSGHSNSNITGATELVSNPTHPSPTKEPEPNEKKIENAEKEPSPSRQLVCAEEEDMQVDQPVPAVDPAPSSFAPRDFIFQAPAGLSSFKFEPLTPRSADAFLTPSPTLNLPSVTSFALDPPAEPSKPSPPSPAVTAASPHSPLESKHDVPYFRSEIIKETEGLTACCHHWESKVEDESIPEEMRDRMRTAVGQARLLMKERFNQFSGLVDDCELGRGEKVTTCTDLQGFWDMVYYQVEDVNKKFDALKEAESRYWVEECRPPPLQRKTVKKPSAARAKPTVTNAAAKSRLAAVKAAMRAKQQAAEAEQASQDANDDLPSQKLGPQAEVIKAEMVVFDGGFFKVESPAKSSIRRSSRLSAAVLPQASPCSSYCTPQRATRRSLALEHTPIGSRASPVQLSRSTLKQTPASKCPQGTPRSSQKTVASLCFSPVKEVPSSEERSDRSPAQKAGSVSPPAISVDMNSAEPTEGTLLSAACCTSPNKSPSPAPHVREPPSSLSFVLSPCAPLSPPALQNPAETPQSVCQTPNSSVIEDDPGLDFERYFQPSQRGSLSPRELVAEETLSPMATDGEMESPSGQAEPALSAVSSVLSPQSPQVLSAKAALLLFTPDLKDRIRQSVCPTDLMSFTPPSHN